MLHMLASETHSSANDQIAACFAARDLFTVADQHMQLWITGADDGCKFEVPILPNVYGQTALDLCLGLRTSISKNQSGIFREHKK